MEEHGLEALAASAEEVPTELTAPVAGTSEVVMPEAMERLVAHFTELVAETSGAAAPETMEPLVAQLAGMVEAVSKPMTMDALERLVGAYQQDLQQRLLQLALDRRAAAEVDRRQPWLSRSPDGDW